MTRLTDAQIAGLAKGAGLSGDKIVTAVAVALAESAGKSDVLGPPTSYGRAVGVWQIMPLAGRPSTSALKDPNVNAQQMYKISNGGTNWRPWEAYTNGSYRLFLPRARKAAGNPDTSGNTSGGNSGVEQASNPLSWPGEILDFFTFISDPITWMRLGMIVAGGVAVIYSLAQMSGQVDKVKSAVGVATDILPQTRGIKAAAKAV